MPLKAGELFGDYVVERLLGKGGMGAVYLVRSPDGSRYAVKVMYPDKMTHDLRKRFAREAEFAMKIRHRNLISVYDVGEDPETGLCYIIMDYVSGGSLSDRLKANGRLPVAEAVSIAMQIAAGLDVAHRGGLVHRDVKPDNILFDADGTPKLADLGVAKFDDDRKTMVTMTGMIIGTPAYMSPEQLMDSHRIDARADIYSLGIVLYEMLAGDRPNSGSTAVELLAKAIKGEELPDIRKMRPEISASIAHVLSLMCAAKPEERPATSLAAAELLHRATTGKLVLPKKPPKSSVAIAEAERVAKRKRAVSVTLVAVGLLTFLFAGTVGLGYVFLKELDRKTEGTPPMPDHSAAVVTPVEKTNIVESVAIVTNVVQKVTVMTNVIERVAVVTNVVEFSNMDTVRADEPASEEKPAADHTVQNGQDVSRSRYCVIDLSPGPSADSYAVSYLTDEPKGGWTDEYKTNKLVLRRIDAGMDPLGRYSLSRSYYMGVFEVTQKQWALVMGTNPVQGGADNSAVVMVSMDDIRGVPGKDNGTASLRPSASSFIGRLASRTGLKNLDLPTVAQWEYACRAGTKTWCYLGDDDNSYRRGSVGRIGYAVGTPPSNAWGLYDMIGNVWERCRDFRPVLTGVDPVGRVDGYQYENCGGRGAGSSGRARENLVNAFKDRGLRLSFVDDADDKGNGARMRGVPEGVHIDRKTKKEDDGKMPVKGDRSWQPGFSDLWFVEWDKAWPVAKKTNKKLFVLNNGSDWCHWSRKLQAEVLETQKFIAYAQKNLVLVYLDNPRRNLLCKEQKIHNREIIKALEFSGSVPHAMILTSGGKQLGLIAGGGQAVDAYIERIKAIMKGKGTRLGNDRAKMLFQKDGYKKLKAKVDAYYAKLPSVTTNDFKATLTGVAVVEDNQRQNPRGVKFLSPETHLEVPFGKSAVFRVEYDFPKGYGARVWTCSDWPDAERRNSYYFGSNPSSFYKGKGTAYGFLCLLERGKACELRSVVIKTNSDPELDEEPRGWNIGTAAVHLSFCEKGGAPAAAEDEPTEKGLDAITPYVSKTELHARYRDKDRTHVFVEVCHQHDDDTFTTPHYTLDRVREAISAKADIFFLGLGRSKDGVLFSGGENLERISNGTGKMGDYTAAQLKRMKVKKQGRLTTKGFATFEDMLKLGKGKILFKISSAYDHAKELETLLDRLNAWESVIVEGWDVKSARQRYGQKIWNKIRSGEVQIMVGDTFKEWLHVTQEFSVWGWNVNLSEKGLIDIPQRVAVGFMYGAGEAERTDDEVGWEKALKEGVTVFRTNRPKELIKYLKKCKRRN